VVLGQLQLAVTVRGPHHRDVAPDAVEPNGAVRPEAFDLRLAFQLHTELSEERDGSVQVVDNDGHVVHPLNGHVSSISSGKPPAAEEGCVLAGLPRPGAASERSELADRAAQAGATSRA
jgi:hypothetical protein